MELAQMLIAQMSKPFSASEYKDESRDQLISFIQRKIAGEEVVIQPPTAPTTVIDLMAALQASLDAIKVTKESKSPKRKKKSSKITHKDQPSPNSTETA
jgi:DNA end-binding protein Ku